MWGGVGGGGGGDGPAVPGVGGLPASGPESSWEPGTPLVQLGKSLMQDKTFLK